jgi:hypothetical protein
LSALKSKDCLIAKPEVVLHNEFNDRSVLYNPQFDEAIATGPVGVAIWNAFNGRRSLADIAALIRAEFEEAPETVLEDTLTFSLELYRRFFIIMAPEGNES